MSQRDFFFSSTSRSKVFNYQKSKFRLSPLQTHQSKCSLANKNWTNHNAASVPITSSSLTRSTLSDAGKTASYANGTSVSQYIPDNCNQSVTSGGSLAGTQSRGAPRSIPRAKSSDTFEHAGKVQLGLFDLFNNGPAPLLQKGSQFLSRINRVIYPPIRNHLKCIGLPANREYYVI